MFSSISQTVPDLSKNEILIETSDFDLGVKVTKLVFFI